MNLTRYLFMFHNILFCLKTPKFPFSKPLKSILHLQSNYFLIDFKIGVAQELTSLYVFSNFPFEARNKSFASL